MLEESDLANDAVGGGVARVVPSGHVDGDALADGISHPGHALVGEPGAQEERLYPLRSHQHLADGHGLVLVPYQDGGQRVERVSTTLLCLTGSASGAIATMAVLNFFSDMGKPSPRAHLPFVTNSYDPAD